TYEFQLSTDGGFSTTLVDLTGIATTSVSPAATLAAGTVYFWRVTAQHPSGNVVATGSPFSFTTLAPTPGAFTLSTPANRATDVLVRPSFTWTSSVGTGSYRLQIARDAGFAVIVGEQAGLTATSATSTVTLQPETPYFWRVIAESTSTVTAS